MDRRTLIRLLVALGIGIPVLLEGATFAGLLGDALLGDGSADAGGTATATPVRRVGVGEELLPGTVPRETLNTATIASVESGWTLTLTVRVENAAALPYELRLSSITLDDGRTIEGGASTGRIEPGGSASVTAQWTLPTGSTPRAVDVISVRYGDEGATSTRESVHLEKIPVQGS